MTVVPMRTSFRAATIISSVITVLLWMLSLFWFPQWAVLIATIGPLLVFAAIAAGEYKEDETPDGFFLANRLMSPRDLPSTFVVTNVGLFSSIFYSMVLSHYYGLRGMLYPLIGWFMGMYLYSRAIPSLIPFLRRGHTLHEFIAVKYGSSDQSTAALRVVGAAVTSVLYWLSIALEVAFMAYMLKDRLGAREAVFVASLIAGTAIVYTVVAGYKGVVRTDQIQYWMMFFGALVLLVFSIHLIAVHPTKAPLADLLRPSTLIPARGDTFLIGSMVTVILYQFCIMDMWQRSIAVAGNFLGSDKDLALTIKRELFNRSVVPFLLLFICWYSMGIAVFAASGLQEDPNSILSNFMRLVLEQHGIVGVAVESLLFLVFIVAVVSTADSFLIALVQTFMYDIFGSVGLRGRALLRGETDRAGLHRFIDLSRFALLGFGASAVAMALVKPDFARSWLFMYALMFPLFPPVYYAIVGKQGAFSSRGVLVAIIGGFVCSFSCGILGTFCSGLTFLADIAPLVAVVVSWVLMKIDPWRADTKGGR